MFLAVRQSLLSGSIRIPASKSHTIRGVIMGTLAHGISTLIDPLDAADTQSAVQCCEKLGATIRQNEGCWLIEGIGGSLPRHPVKLDVGNSGTTLGNLITVCATGEKSITLDGDASIQSRPFAPLLASLEQLGAVIESTGPNGTAPITIHGPLRGGEATVDETTSIYLTPLLVACPLAPHPCVLRINGEMNEQGYVRMTLDWLQTAQVECTYNEELTRFEVPGGQAYRPFERVIPADFSSAAFPVCAAILAVDGEVTVHGLDFHDTQGDKKVFDVLCDMGADLKVDGRHLVVSRAERLCGARIDLSATPDALPILAVVGCAAEGETILENVAMARIKETDRIAVMREELSKMGADIEEMPAGLIVRKSDLRGAIVDGHDDHRVVMALAVAGLIAEGTTRIKSAESVQITYPTFVPSMKALGARLEASGD